MKEGLGIYKSVDARYASAGPLKKGEQVLRWPSCCSRDCEIAARMFAALSRDAATNQ